MNNAMIEVLQERKRQDKKFGIQNNNQIEWVAILVEEVGEASKEAVDWHFGFGIDDPTLTVAIQTARQFDYRKEMIQVSATALSAVQSFDRQTDNAYIPTTTDPTVSDPFNYRFLDDSIELIKELREKLYDDTYNVGILINKDDAQSAAAGALATVKKYDDHIELYNSITC